MAAVSCPSCGEEVDDGAAICPHCDAVLDASAFEGGGEGNADEAEAEAPPPPKKTAGSKPAGPGKPAAAAPAVAIPETWGRGARRRKKAEVDYSPDRILGDTLDTIRAMLPFDQLAFWGMFSMALSLLFPWRFTQVEGNEIGAFGGGWPVVLLLVLAGAALFVRTSDNLRGLPPHHLALGQIIAAILSIVYCAWYFVNAIDNHPYRTLLGTTDLKISSPQLGVVVCALAAIVMGAGSVWAWTVENASSG
jgi:hypothetical protein